VFHEYILNMSELELRSKVICFKRGQSLQTVGYKVSLHSDRASDSVPAAGKLEMTLSGRHFTSNF